MVFILITILNMFFNNVSADGFDTEGLGSVLSFKLMSYGISRSLNIDYIDNKFENIAGYTYENLDIVDYSEKLHNHLNFNFKNTKETEAEPFDIFFDYPNKEPISTSNKFSMLKKRDLFFWLFSQNIKKIQEKEYILSLQKDLKFKNKELYFKNDLNIAIHLRAPRQDIDVRFEGSRNLFYGSYQDVDRINNTIRQIEHSENDKKLNFHIVSTGDKKLFDQFDTLFDRNEIHLHIERNVFDSFDILTHSDLLIVCGSGLSYSAHLLNKNTSLIPINTNIGKRVFYNNSVALDEKGLIGRLNYAHKLF